MFTPHKHLQAHFPDQLLLVKSNATIWQCGRCSGPFGRKQQWRTQSLFGVTRPTLGSTLQPHHVQDSVAQRSQQTTRELQLREPHATTPAERQLWSPPVLTATVRAGRGPQPAGALLLARVSPATVPVLQLPALTSAEVLQGCHLGPAQGNPNRQSWICEQQRAMPGCGSLGSNGCNCSGHLMMISSVTTLKLNSSCAPACIPALCKCLATQCA